MIIIKLYSFELSDKELMHLGRVIAAVKGMNGYPLPLAADPERGRQIELILTKRNTPLAP